MARPTLRRTGDDQRPPAGHPPSRPARRPPPTPYVVTALAHDRRTAASGRQSAEANRPPRRLTRRSEHAVRRPAAAAACHVGAYSAMSGTHGHSRGSGSGRGAAGGVDGLRGVLPQHGFADLGGYHDRQGHGGADQPLPDVEPDGFYNGLEDAQDGGQDQQDEGPAGGDDERLVGERVEGERRVPLVFGLDREEQKEQRKRDHAHGPGDGEPVYLVRPADHAEGADRHQEAGEGEPDDEPAGQDRPAGRQRRAFHQPGGGFAVAEPDRLDGQHGEAHPQRLQRKQWYALGDVEDAGAEERGDVTEQAADLEPDVPGEVVIQPASQFDGPDDGGEVVVGQDHHRGFLGHLGAGAHRDPDVGLFHRGSVVDAVPGHRDDLALLPEDVD